MLKAFFKTFEVASAPYYYWYSRIPSGVLGTDPRKLICNRLTASGEESECASVEQTVWGNSAGVTAQAHYDRGCTIHIQLSGQKTWTFWAPEALPSMCYYPFSHPGSRQSAADMGDGIGVNCPPLASVHNRTVTCSAGDAIIFPPYWSHRVETSTATISYSIGYEGADVTAYDKVEKSVYEYLMFSAKKELHLQYGGGPGATVKNEKRTDASAAFRIVLRHVLKVDAQSFVCLPHSQSSVRCALTCSLAQPTQSF
jgi:hypothetical protein